MKKYLIFIAKVAAFIVPIFTLFVFFFNAGYAPILTNSVSFDAKLRYAKKENIKQVDLMAMGSSMTLNNLSSQVIKDSLPMSYFNFSAWGLQINDTKEVLINYLPKYKPKYLILVSSIPDFAYDYGIAESVKNFFNNKEYFDNNLEGYFYIKNFNTLMVIVRRKKEMEAYTSTINNYESLHFDKFGGVLLTVPPESISSERWNLNIPFPNRYTSVNYQALAWISAHLKANNIKLIFVQPPIKKQYVKPLATRKAVDNHFVKCKNIVEKSGGLYLNLHGENEFSNDSLFVDQFHLSAVGAAIFTKKAAHAIRSNVKM